MWMNSTLECQFRNLRWFKTLERMHYEQNSLVDDTAERRWKMLVFWEKHGIQATIDAYGVSKRTLYLWKRKLKQWAWKLFSLSNKSTTPRKKRMREWDYRIREKIQDLREEYPNLWKEKIYPILKQFCTLKWWEYPWVSTIWRLIKDMGWLRVNTQKRRVSHRKNILRKPDNLKATYPGEVIALDSIEVRMEWATKRYVITVIDIYSRFSYAVVTNSHSSLTAMSILKSFEHMFPFEIKSILTDNGSEFALNFRKYAERGWITHYHTYPRSPKMNAHCERYNRTIREWVLNINRSKLIDLDVANELVWKFLAFYNCKRVHYAFKNKLTPLQKLMLYDTMKSQTKNCKRGWTYTFFCILWKYVIGWRGRYFFNLSFLWVLRK